MATVTMSKTAAISVSVVASILVIGLVVGLIIQSQTNQCLNPSSASASNASRMPIKNVRKLPVDSRSPRREKVKNAVDGKINTKYLNFYGNHSGLELETQFPIILTGLRTTTANDGPGRDPLLFRIDVLLDSGPYKGSWMILGPNKYTSDDPRFGSTGEIPTTNSRRNTVEIDLASSRTDWETLFPESLGRDEYFSAGARKFRIIFTTRHRRKWDKVSPQRYGDFMKDFIHVPQNRQDTSSDNTCGRNGNECMQLAEIQLLGHRAGWVPEPFRSAN